MSADPREALDRLTPEQRADRVGLTDHLSMIEKRRIRSAIASAIRDAQAAERERCARIADDMADNGSRADSPYDGGAGSMGYEMACDHIAAAIRQSPED